MDKLYAGTNPIGVISELLLAVLNSNAHVYQVSPVLTLMEIEVTKAVGQLFGMGEVTNKKKRKKKKRNLFYFYFRKQVVYYARVVQRLIY